MGHWSDDIHSTRLSHTNACVQQLDYTAWILGHVCEEALVCFQEVLAVTTIPKGF